jgi:ankyrin repeat protein
MNKLIRGNAPTERMNKVTKFRYTVMRAQHTAGKAGKFFFGINRSTTNFFRRFKKPLIAGAITAAVATTALAATISSLDEPPRIVMIGPSQVKQQLLDATKKGDVRGIKNALRQGPSVNSRDELGETPLHIVSRSGNLELMKLFLDADANPNLQDNEGWTPLIAVSREGHLEAAKLLLDSGANSNLFNKSRETALFWAATKGNNELAKLLLEKSADVNAANKHGVTPLMQAASRGHLELCLTLLSADAEVNKHDVEGRTALDYAQMGNLWKHGKVARLLKSKAYGAKNGEN